MTPLMTHITAKRKVRKILLYGFVEDNGLLNEVPESLRMYFDYEAYARDLFSDGYVFHDGYVFQKLNNVRRGNPPVKEEK